MNFSSWRGNVSGSYDIVSISNGMASMMSLNISLNASVGSTEVLVATGGEVLLGTVE